MVWNVGLDVVREVEVILGCANDESHEDTKDGLVEGVGDGFHGHTASTIDRVRTMTAK